MTGGSRRWSLGGPVDDVLWRLAHVLAAFHAGAGRSHEADVAAGLDVLAGRWADNTAGLREHAGRFVGREDVDRAQALAER